MKLSCVLSGMLLQDEDANRGEKESPPPPQQATHALPPVHPQARPNQRQRYVSLTAHLFDLKCILLEIYSYFKNSTACMEIFPTVKGGSPYCNELQTHLQEFYKCVYTTARSNE